VEGTVLSLSGDPIRKATVHLQDSLQQPDESPTGYSDVTDTAGKFVFENVAPGRYTLSADKPGFVTTRYGARSDSSSGTQLNLTAGTEMKGLAVKMTPQGIIAGKVLDQDGDPVVSVEVQAMRFFYSFYTGGKQLESMNGALTNGLGEYRIINLAPGRYFITVTDRRNFAQERPGRAGTVQEGAITTYYPNGADVSAAVAVEVAAGADMGGMDIRLLQAKMYTVRGKTAGASGTPPSAYLLLTRKDSGNLIAMQFGGDSTQVRPDGTFEFHRVVPGTYVLQLEQSTVNGKEPVDLTGRIEITVGNSNIDDLVLPLMPHLEIRGTIQLEDGDIATLIKPGQNTPGVAVSGDAVKPRILLLPDRSELPRAGAPIADFNEDGTLRFDSLGLGKYALYAVTLPEGTYLKSARFGGQDVLHTPIDTTSGTGGTLDLVLSSKAATVTGSVHSEKGEALVGTTVALWPKTPDSSFRGGIRTAMTDQSGAFKFAGLAPGDYYVASWEDLYEDFAKIAEVLSHFTSEASAITLSEGGQESRDLKPVPADKVAAEVAKLQ
jgi:protocatechuate 3,4-dioxygenase beta subunit